MVPMQLGRAAPGKETTGGSATVGASLVTGERACSKTVLMPAMRTDEELLTAVSDAEAFGELYRRTFPLVAAYLVRRVGNAELAADLAAETYATALGSRNRYQPRKGSARTWLLTIAHARLVDAVRRHRVEDRARRKLGMEPMLLDDEDLARIDSYGTNAESLLGDLSPDQAAAIRARVFDERAYEEIARSLSCSPSVVRQRVKRGLDEIRHALKEEPST